MKRWCTRFAGEAGKLSLLQVEEGHSKVSELWCEKDVNGWWGEGNVPEGSEFGLLEPVRVARGILGVVKERKPDLLVLQDRISHPEVYRKAIQHLVEEVTCPVMVMRLGEGAGERVLLPCAGGPHSRRGLKVAADALGEDLTAFYVEPDVDEVSQDVGVMQLARSLKKSGVKDGQVQTKVVMHNDVFEAIREEVNSEKYGMLLIGASGIGSVRKKLFGTVPDRLMRGEEGMSVGIIRGERSAQHKLRHRMERMMMLTIPQLNRNERVTLFDEIEEKARWSFDFASLMALATAIAALGLLSDSGAVVIGAMLVAPLMTPLLGGGLAVVQGNWPLWRNCQKAVGLGFLLALAVGVVFGLIARAMGLGLTDELLARGAPSILDLGIAFISGIAASYCLARPKLSGALAGVAIAAALVPPIATVGVCLALQKFEVSQGAAILFGTNVVAIVLGSATNFFVAGIRGRSSSSAVWAKRTAIVFTLVMAGLMVPLSSTIVKKIAGDSDLTNRFDATASKYGAEVSQVRKLVPQDGVQFVEITLDAPEKASAECVSALQREANRNAQRPMKLRVITRLVTELD
ncbi:DUF389 domain-containing protein [Rubritalea sp.]|uniref:DUF389 domain-containing protein n=1 Tax=Rubritalea sp. TaxID=2109375 RepID=UPI003EF869AE